MVNEIRIQKIANGYVVYDNWYRVNEDHAIYFKDMEQLLKNLDDCFAKPFKDLTYVTKLVKE